MKCFALLIFSFLSAYGITQQIKIVGSCIDKRGKPLESVQIEVNTIPSSIVFSDSLGAYSFTTSTFDTLKIKLSIDEYREIRLLYSANTPKFSYVIKAVQFPIQQERTVQVISSKDDPFEITKLAPFDPQRITGSVERTLTLITAAVSNNELTTNYKYLHRHDSTMTWNRPNFE